ncbi:hypothetical protein BDP27DRAFT_1293847 [Rhodocollybia butyracea]|uniref:MYND-type domain-containing protein n=1 Tax=Rhodocollybia butyracea TaxID=206335 RepID=A0A9P5PUG7_9AGAR|nr:hypothetical protein BDP27DRAFT_1293847 [Rhodocollybia butyracea]
MTRVIKQVTLQMKKPTAPHFLLTHGAAILSTSALHCPNAVLANPSAVHFLIAGLRSSEWENRSASLNGVIRLFRLGADEELRSIDPNIFFRMNTRQFPDHLTDILADYGVFRGEIFITVATAREFQAALMKVVQDHDLYSLGLKLSELITRTEFSIADGAFVAEDPVTGKHDSSFDTGLPFKNYRDALPLCAKLLREKARAGDLDKADILDIKFNIMSANLRLASSIADKGLLRNPEVAYFHYAKTLLADPTIGLRSAKKGLKCKDSTPFIRFQLLQRAVAHAGEMGLQILENTSARIEGEGGRWEEGVAFVMSAWKDSKVFIEEAPPDNRYMSQVLYWNILLGIVIRGPESSDDLNEIQPALQKLSEADEFKTKVFRLPILRTQLRQAQEVVVKKFTGAIAEWDNAILRLNDSSPRTHGSHGHPPHVSPDSDSATAQNDPNEETLNRFLEDLHLDDGGCAAKMTSAHPKVNANRVVLYQCSWCENPSAVLRKCKGCAKTRYCDASCQRLHWGKHKKECKA